MKNSIKIPLFLAAACLLITSSCVNDKCLNTYSYQAWAPLYKSAQEIRAGVKYEAARELKNTGKIYVLGNNLFINEINEGIHFINNSDPTAPINFGFMAIPGNIDISIKGHYLYADSYIDLVVIDISDINNPIEIERIQNTFPQRTKEGALPAVDELGVVVDFEQRTITETYECSSRWYSRGGVTEDWLSSTSNGGTNGFNPQVSGIAGSMARFAVVNGFLYCVGNTDMQLYDLSNAAKPVFSTRVNLGFGIETIFPYNNYLFIGSQTGMLIYNNVNPAAPAYVSTFRHARVCDPVAVEGNTAYVTLRSGNECEGFSNQLDVVDISNVSSPYLVKSYAMTNPHGVGIDNNTLFICDAEMGLKIYDASNRSAIDQNKLKGFNNVYAYDIIPYDGLAILIGKDGLYQYDYTNKNDIKYLSHIPVVKP